MIWTQIPRVATKDMNVLMVDITPDLEILRGIKASARKVMVLDHHQAALATLVAALDPTEFVFDIKRCGASLAWNWCFPHVPRPSLVTYVEAMDLFDWRALMDADKDARNMSLAIEAQVQATPEAMEDALAGSVGFLHDLRTRVMPVVVDIVKLQVSKIIAAVGVRKLAFSGSIATVAVCNTPVYINTVSEHILDIRKDIDVVWLWHVNSHRGSVTVCLRSAGQVEVKGFAEARRGGGHHNAASFRIQNASDSTAAMNKMLRDLEDMALRLRS
jgi:hypothetical protein